LLLAALFAAAPTWAAPFAVQVGEARLGLDAPPGFSDTAFTGSPRLQELAESLTAASNRILLFAISDADLRRFMVGDTPEFRRYMIVVIPKGFERERMTRSGFAALAARSLHELGAPAPEKADPIEQLKAQPEGQATVLARLRKDAEVISVLQGTRLPPARRFSDKPQYGLATTSLVLLRGKPLNLSVYSSYDSPADLEWISTATVRWIEDLQRLNMR
jgi:hypothetical protein